MAARCANGGDGKQLKRPQARPPRPPRPAGNEGTWREEAHATSTTSAPWWADPHGEGDGGSHADVRGEIGGVHGEETRADNFGDAGRQQSTLGRPFQLGGRSFYASEDMTAYFRKILNKTRTGAFLPHGEHAMVMELLQRGHRAAKEKLGPGVSGVTVLPHPQYPDTRCFHLVRVDGTYADFSYRKCVRNITEQTWDSGIVDGTQEMAVGRCESVEQVQRLMDAAVECVDASVLAQALIAMANMTGTGRKLEAALIDRRYLKAETMVTYTLENTGREDALKLLRALRDTKHRPEEMLEQLADNLEMHLDDTGVEKVREVLDCYVQLENKQRGLLHKIEQRLVKEKNKEKQNAQCCKDLLSFAMLNYRPKELLEAWETELAGMISEQGARDITQLLWALSASHLEDSGLFQPALHRLSVLASRASRGEANLEAEEETEIARAYFFLLQKPLGDVAADPTTLLWATKQLTKAHTNLAGDESWEQVVEGLRLLQIPFKEMCTTPFGPCPGLAIATENKGVVLYLQNHGLGIEDTQSNVPRESIGHRVLEGKGWVCINLSQSEWEWAMKQHPLMEQRTRYLSDYLCDGLKVDSRDEIICYEWTSKWEDPDVACQ